MRNPARARTSATSSRPTWGAPFRSLVCLPHRSAHPNHAHRRSMGPGCYRAPAHPSRWTSLGCGSAWRQVPATSLDETAGPGPESRPRPASFFGQETQSAPATGCVGDTTWLAPLFAPTVSRFKPDPLVVTLHWVCRSLEGLYGHDDLDLAAVLEFELLPQTLAFRSIVGVQGRHCVLESQADALEKRDLLIVLTAAQLPTDDVRQPTVDL
jgi:hypothetical protein